MKMTRESWILSAICVLDLATTIWFVSRMGGAEANPIMRYYLDRGILVFIAAKFMLFAGPIFVVEWARLKRPKFATNMLRSGIALYVILYTGGVLKLNRYSGEPNWTEAQMERIANWASTPANAADIAWMRSQSE